ncbi:uncharacterized protein PV07_02718 [Cladophialophora immunda]|uniref:Transcription factor domain-containing protein n=1 Tax=Cladophialophora immunda TaxID=569365 RepID=A0A0D2D5U6_9EURO|nr:uncharacterized protein PV07_02718 [Cladophialophora immunda]KIW31034.1 hypothetical protein PV07_02718 [Cladophialophora immunda]OQV05904.1 Fungal specific transcription factor domain-containing protein [Cladophialophora immunda]
MKNRNPSWGSVRSKLTQEGYMYRMKLGNPAPNASSQPANRRHSSSASSSSVNAPSSIPTDSVPSRSGVNDTVADGGSAAFQTVIELLEHWNLGDNFRRDHDLDPNSTFEFLFQCYAPFVIHRRHRTILFEPGDFLDGLMLHDSMVANAVLVWAADMRERFGTGTQGARDVLLSQRNDVIRELRERISSTETCASDAVMMTILLLVGTELLHDNIDAMGTHLGALRHIIQIRGGMDSPSLSKWVKIPLLQFENFLNYRHFDHVKSSSFEGISPMGEVPHHQPLPVARARLAKLPPGFTELFRSTPVKVQVVNLVERMAQWALQLADLSEAGADGEQTAAVVHAMTLDAFRAFDLLQQDQLEEMERLLVIGLFSFCIFMNGEAIYSVMEWAQRLHCMALVGKPIAPITNEGRASMIWVAAMLMATGGDGSPAWQLGRRINSACSVADAGLQVILQTSQRYFWDQDLTTRLSGGTMGSMHGNFFGDGV